MKTIKKIIFYFLILYSFKCLAYELNPLEKTINIFGGTSSKYDEFIDEGGLNYISDWYGINISAYSLTFDESDDVINISLTTRLAPTSPKEIRRVINTICDFKEKDWEIKNTAGFVAGQAENQYCFASYMPYKKTFRSIFIERLVAVSNKPDVEKIVSDNSNENLKNSINAVTSDGRKVTLKVDGTWEFVKSGKTDDINLETGIEIEIIKIRQHDLIDSCMITIKTTNNLKKNIQGMNISFISYDEDGEYYSEVRTMVDVIRKGKSFIKEWYTDGHCNEGYKNYLELQEVSWCEIGGERINDEDCYDLVSISPNSILKIVK